MKGTVVGINRRLGRVVIQCGGALAIGESSDLNLHENVEGPLEKRGDVVLQSRSGPKRVRMRGIGCTRDFAEGFLENHIG